MTKKMHLFEVMYMEENSEELLAKVQATEIEKVEAWIRSSFLGEVPEENIEMEAYDEGATIFTIYTRDGSDEDTEEWDMEFVEIQDVGTDYREEEVNFISVTGENFAWKENEETGEIEHVEQSYFFHVMDAFSRWQKKHGKNEGEGKCKSE